MSSDERSDREYRFGPLERRGIAGTLRFAQLALLATAATTCVFLLKLLPAAAGLAASALLMTAATAVVLMPIRGRTVEQWAPAALRWLALLGRRERGYRSTRPSGGITAALDGSGLRESVDLPETIAGCEILGVSVGHGEEVGIIRDPANAGALTAVLAVRVRAFGLLGEAEQQRRLERWGRALASLARAGTPVRRVALVERTVPADGDELRRYLAQARDRGLPPADPARRSYESLLEAAGQVTQDHELFLCVQVDARRTPRGQDDALAALLVRELHTFASRFDPHDVSIEGALSPRMLARALHLAFNPYGRERLSRLAVACPEMAGLDPTAWGPTATEVEWNRYRSDSAVHRTFWVRQWPRLPVGPMFLAPLLLTAQAVRTIAVVLEPVAPDRARRAVEAAITSEEADEQVRNERGFRTTARRRRQHDSALRRERELSEGHQEFRFASYVTVSAPESDALELACEEVEQAAHQAHLDLEPLYGEQDTGFTCGALPLCRGLRNAGFGSGGLW